MSTASEARRAYDRALTMRQNILVQFGAAKVAEAEGRLCLGCRFRGDMGVCALNALMLPVTSKGGDCPYYLSRQFAAKSPETG